MPGNYFQAGRAGGSGGINSVPIPFADQSVPPNPFSLVFMDPANPVILSQFFIAGQTLEAGGATVDLFSASEFFPSGTSATAWGTRYRVYAKADTGAAAKGLLFAVDLRKSGTTPANPMPVQLSSGTLQGLQLCSTGPALFDNYRSADQSWVLFHAKGKDNDCGSTDDQFYAFQLAMTAASAPKSLAQLEPVEALYDSSGAITGYLAVKHPPVTAGQPATGVQLQRLKTDFSVSTTFSQTLVGQGLTAPGSGDFHSLGVVAGNLWLHQDSSNIWALNLTTGLRTTGTPLVTLMTGDSLQGRAVIDGSVAYVALNNNTNGSTIARIDTSNSTVLMLPRDLAAATPGIALVGVTSSNLVYLFNDGSSIKSTVKASLPAGVSLQTFSASQKVDMLMGTASPAVPVAFLVGDTVFYTVADSAGAFAKQAFYVIFTGSAPGTATAVAASTSAVLGAMAASPIATSGPVTNTAALVVTGGLTPSAGVATFASVVSGVASHGSVGSYSASGALATAIGPLSSTNVVTGSNLVNPITGVALNAGPVQAGMPAMLELIGLDSTLSSANDIALYTPDMATSLSILSGFDQ
jgi:hypothetical protein